MSFVIGLPLIVSTILVCLFAVESPRYLLTKRKFEEAKKILNRIAVTNDRPPFEFRLYEEMDNISNRTNLLVKKDKDDNGFLEKRKFKFFHGYMDLIRNQKYRWIAIMTCYLWFFQYYIYYGIQFSLSDLGVEAHLSLIFIALGEMFAALAGGRKLCEKKKLKIK